MLITTVLRYLVRESSFLAPDFGSFIRQEFSFIGLNLVLAVALLSTQLTFPGQFGDPPAAFFVLLAMWIALNCAEFFWLRTRGSLSSDDVIRLTWATITLNITVAFGLAYLSYRQDIQYFTLIVCPILQASLRFSLPAVLLTLGLSDSLIFFWVWNYFRLHPPVDPNEYVEAATVSIIYAVVGLLVWSLVSHLRSGRAKLLQEEKLAAVGRLSTAVAHEIRNPVAMILSALTTANGANTPDADRQEMFDIAAKEASRLERLTTDFLTYARPRAIEKRFGDVADSISYITDVCRPRANERGIGIQADVPGPMLAEIDCDQLHQALLNLTMNAIEASPAGASVSIRGRIVRRRALIDVENDHGPIPADAAGRIFEPFFTTKPSGTGLGLAIARGIVQGHGGDLTLSRNEPELVRFTIALPVQP